MHAVIKDLPRDGFLDLWRKEEDGKVTLQLNAGDWISREVLDAWKNALLPHCNKFELADEAGGPGNGSWVKIAFDQLVEMPHEVKEAYSKVMRSLGEVGGYLPGGWADQFGGPTPLTGALASGLIGAGLGYGTGWIGEQLLPRSWRRGRLSRNMAMLGGMVGMAPAAVMALDNVRAGRPLNSGDLVNYPHTNEATHYMKNLETGEPNPDYDPDIPGVPYDYYKSSASRSGFELDLRPAPIIPLDAFNQTIYQDPYVASQLSPASQAAATGLLEAAYQSRGGGPRLIGPADIARISAGMGAGYLSGAIVGKALGALMGMPEPVQDRLRQTGLWAGVVANVVPLAFGMR